MVRVEFPGWYSPGFKIRKGALLWVTLLGIDVIIPPWDITFWTGFWAWRSFTIFDSDWVLTEAQKVIKPIVDGVTGFIKDPKGWVAQQFEATVKGVTDWMKDPKGWLKGEFSGVLSGFTKGLEDTKKAILDPVGKIVPDVNKALDDAKKAVLDPLNKVVPSVKSFIEDPKGWVAAQFTAIPEAVWSLFQKTLDDMVRDYYERHSSEKE